MTTNTVVLALHFQNDVLHEDGKIKLGLGDSNELRGPLVAAAKTLLDGARARGWPIVHVRIAFRADGADIIQNAPIFRAVAASGAVRDGSWGAGFFEALAPDPQNPREWIVKHSRIDAFYGSPLDEVLRACGAQRLVVAGVATHSVVESTVRHAADVGFDVWVASDACAASDTVVHAASLASMRLIATVASVSTCLKAA